MERWSTEAERENLLRTTIDGGPAKLLAALQKHEITTPAGRQVDVATDQHLRFGDPALTPRPTDHELTLISVMLTCGEFMK